MVERMKCGFRGNLVRGFGALLVLIAVATLTPATADGASSTALEAETMNRVSGKTGNFMDRNASGGKARVLLTSGSVKRSVSTPDFSGMNVRVKASRCKGYPIMKVRVDGKQVSQRKVKNKTWKTYGVNASGSSGQHTVSVEFRNDRRQAGCNRSLKLDKIEFIPKAETSVPTTPTNPNPTNPNPVEPETTTPDVSEYASKSNCTASLQGLINDAAAGSTLTVPGGCVYRESVSIGKPLTLIASEGAEIRGSDVWDDFSEVSGRYVSGKSIQSFPVSNAVGCEPNTQACTWPAQVFVNGTPLKQVASSPAAGQFAVNEANKVVLGSSPSGKLVEVTTRDSWVKGRSNGVTVRGFEMKHAANKAQTGAFHNGSFSDWTIEDNIFSLAHGGNVKLDYGKNIEFSGNEVKHGGQLGLSSYKTDSMEVSGNKIHNNNIESFDTSWEAGGAKLATVTNLKFNSNEVYENLGNGIWCDIDCSGVEISNNRAYENSGSAIFYEISDNARIFNNVVWENSWKNRRENNGGSWTSAAIRSASSRNVEIFDNTVAWNRGNIAVVSVKREQSRWNTVSNVKVHNNDIFSESISSSENIHSGHRVHALAWLESWEEGTLFKPDANNGGYSNTYWYESNQNSNPRFYYGTHEGSWGVNRGGLSSLSNFNATRGEENGRYLSLSEKNQIAARADIPRSPDPR